MQDNDLNLSLSQVIPAAMHTYCGARVSGNEMLLFAECGRLIIEHYSHLHIDEILEAFRLAAANKTKANMTAYAGVFSVAMLGDILTAYCDHRASFAVKVRDAMTPQLPPPEFKDADFRAFFDKKIQNEGVTSRHHCAGLSWAIPRIKRIYGELSKEQAAELWLNAKELVVADTSAEVADSKAKNKNNIGLGHILTQMVRAIESESDRDNEAFMAKRTSIYAAMYAWEVIKRERAKMGTNEE